MQLQNSLARSAGWLAYISAAIVTADLAVSILFVTQGWVGPGPHSHSILVESLDVLAALSALALALYLYRLWHSNVTSLFRVFLLVGIVGGLYMAVLHALFVLEVLWFSDSFGAFLLGLLVYAIWTVGIGYYLQTRGHVPHSLLMSVLGATAIGYPVWAYWLGRVLMNSNGKDQEPAVMMGGWKRG